MIIAWLLGAALASLAAAGHGQSQLGALDSLASSSSLGEPVFRLEPASEVHFSNLRGATLGCLASGAPKPQVSWFVSANSGEPFDAQDGRLVSGANARPATPIAGLRELANNGTALRLLPFASARFRQDVHSAEYRCVASNKLATIHSRSVLVQAALASEASQEPKVADEFVQLGQVAVLRCKPASSQPSEPNRSELAEWFTSDGLVVRPRESPAKANRLTAFASGELHIERVDLRDLQRTYGCRTRQPNSHRLVSTSGLAQLIASDPIGAPASHAQPTPLAAPEFAVIHSTSQLISADHNSNSHNSNNHNHNNLNINEKLNYHSNDHNFDFDFGDVHFEPRTTGLNGQNEHQHEWLLLPCAVRASAGPTPELRWSFEPANSRLPAVEIEQWAAQNSMQISYQTNGQHLFSVNATTGVPNRAGAPSPLRGSSSGSRAPRIVVAASYLAIERPTRELSGRYVARVDSKSLCDIHVIIRSPLRVQMRVAMAGSAASIIDTPTSAPQSLALQSAVAGSQTASTNQTSSSSPSTILDSVWRLLWTWKGAWPRSPTDNQPEGQSRPKRQSMDSIAELPSSPLVGRIRVRGHGRVPPPASVRVGRKLELECSASGYPVDQIRWFRNGIAINTQSSQDFQVQITQSRQLNSNTTTTATLISTITIRQVQPRDLGAQMFECFAHNSLGDRARAGKLVLITDDSATTNTNLNNGHEGDQLLRNNREGDDVDDYDVGSTLIGGHNNPNELFAPECPRFSSVSATSGDDDNSWAWPSASASPQRPKLGAVELVVEGEQVELSCPVELPEGGQTSVEWRKLGADDLQQAYARLLKAARGAHGAPKPEPVPILAGPKPLLGVDSRLFLNGTQLELRAPSGRHDQGLYACWAPDSRQREGVSAPPALGLHHRELQHQSYHHQLQPQLPLPVPVALVHHQSLLDSTSTGLADSQQATAASSLLSCLGVLLTLLFGSEQPANRLSFRASNNDNINIKAPELQNNNNNDNHHLLHHHHDHHLRTNKFASRHELDHHHHHRHYQLAIASLRVVAKPKLEPFEFSRSLEEGMRAVVVCATTSGRGPVEFSWFKNGHLLPNSVSVMGDKSLSSTVGRGFGDVHDGQNEDYNNNDNTDNDNDDNHNDNSASGSASGSSKQRPEQSISIEQTNGFASTLTFHHIKPIQSGIYTCVASNAFGCANHSSQLTVNVAPFFVEPPVSSQAILGSNLMVNCRAAGQPSPQIRWRKLVSGGSLASPSKGSQLQHSQQQLSEPDLAGLESAKLDYKIITSNSHIQILENGSMIIKDVELSDASRYVCQASNGVSPSLSEVINVSVLSPARFDINYESLSVKRESMVKFNCAPKGDQPIQIEWLKESNVLVGNSLLANSLNQANPLDNSKPNNNNKYSELVHYYNSSEPGRRHHSLTSSPQQANPSSTSQQAAEPVAGLKSSELIINYADRTDSGTFVCVARNAYGKDELTYKLTVQEAPDAPTSLSGQSVASSSLRLLWQVPFDGNSAISQYYVEFRSLNPSVTSSPSSSQEDQHPQHREWTRLVVTSNGGVQSPLQPKVPQLVELGGALVHQQSAQQQLPAMTQQQHHQQQQQQQTLIRQLRPRSLYQFRVAAVNQLGQSQWSLPLSVMTAEEPPNGRPNELRAQPYSSSQIKVYWRAPPVVDEWAPIKGYYVSYRKLMAPNEVVGAPPNPSDTTTSSPWIASASLAASNSSALDPASTIKSPGATTSEAYELTLGGLERNVRYEIRVQPYNSVGVGPPSDTQATTAKFDRPAAPQLRLVAARRHSMELRWLLPTQTDPNFPSEPVIGFSLYYKTEYDDWQEVQLGLVYSYVIQQLRCGNKYQIYLSAFNSVGRSDPSEVVSARTEGLPPEAPQSGHLFVTTNSTRLILDMSQWQTGNSCPLTNFMVQFKQVHDSNWFVLSDQLTQPQAPPSSSSSTSTSSSSSSSSLASTTSSVTSSSIVIPDLQPATWYKLLINAVNEAGSSNAEYVVATLNPNGEPIATPPPSDLSSSPSFAGGSSLTASASLLSGLRGLFGALDRNATDPTRRSASGIRHDQITSGNEYLLPTACMLLLLALSSIASYLYYFKPPPGSKTSSLGTTCSLRGASGGSGSNHAHLLSGNDNESPNLSGYPNSKLTATCSLQQTPVPGGSSWEPSSSTSAYMDCRDNITHDGFELSSAAGQVNSSRDYNNAMQQHIESELMCHNLNNTSGACHAHTPSHALSMPVATTTMTMNRQLASLQHQQHQMNSSRTLGGSRTLNMRLPNHGLAPHSGCSNSSQTNSSSISTHSTNCIDGQSSSNSSSTNSNTNNSNGNGNFGLNRKLHHLVQQNDQSNATSHLLIGHGEQHQPFNPYIRASDLSSNANNTPCNLDPSGNHVNLLANLNGWATVGAANCKDLQAHLSSLLIGEQSSNNQTHSYQGYGPSMDWHPSILDNIEDHNQHHRAPQLTSSASFVSGPELLQRQLANHHQLSQEPIYQKLDKSHNGGLYGFQSKTLRIGSNNNDKCMTMQRRPNQNDAMMMSLAHQDIDIGHDEIQNNFDFNNNNQHDLVSSLMGLNPMHEHHPGGS